MTTVKKTSNAKCWQLCRWALVMRCFTLHTRFSGNEQFTKHFMVDTSFDLQSNLTGLLLSRDVESESAHSSLPSTDVNMPDWLL